MVDEGLFQITVVGWLAAAALTVVLHRRRNGEGTGLVLWWLLSLALIHWLVAAAYALPWYVAPSPEQTWLGFVQSTCAVIGFGVGVVLLAPALRLLDPATIIIQPRASASRTPSVGVTYIVVGAVSFFFLERLVGGIPTVAAIVSTGLSVLIGGVCLSCSKALSLHSNRGLIGWLLASAGLPVFTLVSQGFLGAGAFAFLVVCCFVAVRYRPRLRVIAVAFAVAYIGLSVYVTYMRDRSTIRDSVWGGASYSDRFDQVAQSISGFEWFDPTNTDHLARIDLRLNQDTLVGAAVEYLAAGNRDFANGQTVWDAVIAVVPRALWPTKPVEAGSGSLVSDYTGLQVSAGTSVGVGPVMEFYINFGTVGVVVGFILVGAIVGALDRAAGLAIAQGDVDAFTFRFVPALAFMNVGGSLVELTGTTAASLVMVFFLNRFLLPVLWRRQERNVANTLRRRPWVATGGPAGDH